MCFPEATLLSKEGSSRRNCSSSRSTFPSFTGLPIYNFLLSLRDSTPLSLSLLNVGYLIFTTIRWDIIVWPLVYIIQSYRSCAQEDTAPRQRLATSDEIWDSKCLPP